jgi:hypothetical protein
LNWYIQYEMLIVFQTSVQKVSDAPLISIIYALLGCGNH